MITGYGNVDDSFKIKCDEDGGGGWRWLVSSRRNINVYRTGVGATKEEAEIEIENAREDIDKHLGNLDDA